MSRFFAANYDYEESGSSSSEEDLLSSSGESDLMMSSSGEEDFNEESDDSFFDNDDESEDDDDTNYAGNNFGDSDSDSKPYGPDWFKKSEFRKGPPQNKFLKSSNKFTDSSDEESESEMDEENDNLDENGKRYVKSAKDRLFDDMTSIYNKINKKLSNPDWTTILTDFDTLLKTLVKCQQQNFGIPNIFIKNITLINSLTQGYDGDFENKSEAKSHNILKQRIKKTIKDYSDLVEKYNEDPTLFDKEETVMESLESTPMLSNNKQANLTSKQGFFVSLKEVTDSRGRKNVNSNELIDTMNELIKSTTSPYELIVAYLNLIPIRFESSANLSYQPIDQWNLTFDDIVSFITILESNIKEYVVSESAPVNEFIETEPEKNINGIKLILGSIFSFVDRLDDEFNKSLLNIDPHSSDYLKRLKDEQKIYTLLIRVQLYLQATENENAGIQSLARVYIKRLDHIYYKSTKLGLILEKTAWNKLTDLVTYKRPEELNFSSETYMVDLINKLSSDIEGIDNKTISTSAVLYQIYFTAMNEDFNKAKNMLLEANNIQSFINNAGPSLQILFNRVVVQLGLSAFEAGLIEECHQVLNELLSTAHLREILGQQSLQRLNHSHSSNNNVSSSGFSSLDSSPEEQCLPFHKHINLDLIDIVFMTCSLLIEIPQMTAFFSGIKIKRSPYSQKSIRRSIEHFDKQSFHGPPETSRDYVVYAAKSMQKGDWEKTFHYLQEIKAWKFLPNYEIVLKNLLERIQIESLKTYFFNYKRFYSTISIDKLSELFNLSYDKIILVLHDVIKELEITAASVDTEKNLIVLEKGDEITKLEEVALRLNKEYKINRERYYTPRR